MAKSVTEMSMNIIPPATAEAEERDLFLRPATGNSVCQLLVRVPAKRVMLAAAPAFLI
jgi:hypothetical protein